MRVLVIRYITLWKTFFSNCLTRELEFKFNFLGNLFVDSSFYISQYFFFHIIFSYVDALGAFKRDEIIIFLLVTYIADAIFNIFFGKNLYEINRSIVKGNLDFLLIKPINHQFYISFRYVGVTDIVQLIILFFILIKAYSIYSINVEWLNIIIFSISLLCGVLIWYSVEFLLFSLAFWFRSFGSAGWLSNNFIKFSRRPDSIFTGLLRKTLMSFIPMAMICSVPTRFLIFSIDYQLFSLQIFISLIFLYVTTIIWKKGLFRYESASS